MSRRYNLSLGERISYTISKYSWGILIPLFILALVFVSVVDGGAEQGAYPIEKTAIVQVVITLEDGNTYVVEEATKNVIINTYGVSDETQWDIVKY